MPKRDDLSSIMIIGAGPIIIGQACEFDYSGTQACKALRAEGYRVILINSNPATIMTDPEMADATYIEPITPDMVTRVLERERPDAVLPTMGGQTALNCALDLDREGVLAKHKVELIAASRAAQNVPASTFPPVAMTAMFFPSIPILRRRTAASPTAAPGSMTSSLN